MVRLIPLLSLATTTVAFGITAPEASRTVPETEPSPAVACAYAPATKTSAQIDRASIDRKSTRLNSSHLGISYAVFCLKKMRPSPVPPLFPYPPFYRPPETGAWPGRPQLECPRHEDERAD